MKEMPLVSVIIPTYKRSNSLERAIDSVLNQENVDVQVIVVDDNEPDTEYRKITENKIKKYDDDKRVVYIQHDHNKNGSAARNTGWRASIGKYLAFLDDDDFYYNNKLYEQVKYLEKDSGVDCCWCDYIKNGKSVRIPADIDIASSIFLGEETPQTSSWLIRRECVEELNGFDESYYRHQDYEFLLRLIRKGKVLGKIDDILYERTVTDIDNNPSGKRMETIKKKLLSDFSDIIEKCEDSHFGITKHIRVATYICVGKCYLKGGSLISALKYVSKAFVTDPRFTIKEIIATIKSHC